MKDWRVEVTAKLRTGSQGKLVIREEGTKSKVFEVRL